MSPYGDFLLASAHLASMLSTEPMNEVLPSCEFEYIKSSSSSSQNLGDS